MDQCELSTKRDEALKLVMGLCSNLAGWHPLLVDDAWRFADRIIEAIPAPMDETHFEGINGAEIETTKTERPTEWA